MKNESSVQSPTRPWVGIQQPAMHHQPLRNSDSLIGPDALAPPPPPSLSLPEPLSDELEEDEEVLEPLPLRRRLRLSRLCCVFMNGPQGGGVCHQYRVG